MDIEHPDITSAIRTGYPGWYDEDYEEIGNCFEEEEEEWQTMRN